MASTVSTSSESSSSSTTMAEGALVSTASKTKKKKKVAKRLWLPWEFCKLIEPEKEGSLPPFGCEKPSCVTDDEKKIISSESEALFPVGFYDMTPAKRGVTKGRGDWKGKEALRLAHCSAEKNGCRFKARFCRVRSGMEIFTSGTHDIKAHLTPRKRGLAPAARAIVTKYREESQSKLVEWLKDGGLLDDVGGDLEKVKQQIKRRKMTLKRKQKRVAMVSQSEEDEDDVDNSEEGDAEIEDDPLYSAKINMLQDDSIVSLIDPPEHGRMGPPPLGAPGMESPRPDPYQSDEEPYPDGAPFIGSNPFGDGPYSPTTVIDVDTATSHPYSFQSVFETPPLLHTTDLFPRSSHDFPLTHVAHAQAQAQKREKHFVSPPPPPSPPAPPSPPTAGLDPSGTYYHAAV